MNYRLWFIEDGNLAVKWFKSLQDAINWGKEWTIQFRINSPYIPGDICKYSVETGFEYTEEYVNWREGFLNDGTWQSQTERDQLNQIEYQKVSGE